MVDLHGQVEAVGRGDALAGRRSGVAGQDIDPVIGRAQLAAQLAYVIEPGEVGAVAIRRPAAGRVADLFGSGSQPLPVAADDHDMVAAGGEPPGRGQSDARARPRNDHDLVHLLSLRRYGIGKGRDQRGLAPGELRLGHAGGQVWHR